MKIIWKRAAVQSLLKLDLWRLENEWAPISSVLVETIETYFTNQDLSIFVPGRVVSIKSLPVDMRMVLISLGKSEPYKVFYRQKGTNIEVYLIRHPRQKSIL